MKNRKNVSEYESENLMNTVIEKVLNLPEFQNLDRVLHQPLKMLIRNPEKLEEDECRFAMNVLTHTDFVIFNKLDQRPVLVVEVDGYVFHAGNPKQLERDQMKDRILRKCWINKLIESHPELCFAKLNRNQPILENKCTKEGEQKRLEVKQKYYPDARLVVNKYLADVPYRKKTDDVIDALCLAVTGMIGNENGFVTIPETPITDKTGLWMQMVCPII